MAIDYEALIEEGYEETRKIRDEREHRGTVARAHADSSGRITSGLVDWRDSEVVGPDPEHGHSVYRPRAVTQHPSRFRFEVTPLGRRSDQARLEEMTRVLVDWYRRYHTFPESILREIQGLYWKHGQTEFSMSELQQIAGHYLRLGEKENEKTDHGNVTRSR